MNRKAVETVWLQAMFAVWPISTSGTPNSDAPSTFTWPGTVICVW